MRAGKYFMDYIAKSVEQPLGPVKKFWWRWEYQEANGNVPHIHALLWTGEEKSGDGLLKIQRWIGCSTLIFHNDEVKQKLIDLEIIENKDDPAVYCIMEECGRIQKLKLFWRGILTRKRFKLETGLICHQIQIIMIKS